MYANQHLTLSQELSFAARRVMAEIDEACLILASEIARGLRKRGFRKAANWLTPLGGPLPRT